MAGAGAESKKISERVRANMSKAVAKGVHVGPAPYGLRPIKTLVNGKVVTTWELDPVEAPVVREMVRLMVEENRGYGDVANALNARGTYNRSGHPWGAWAIKIILDNEAIIGDLVYGKKAKAGTASNELVRVPGFFPAIISTEEWNQLQERRDIRRETPKGKTHSSEFLLSGLIRCGECGSAMKGHSGALRRDGSRYSHYICTLASKSRARCSQSLSSRMEAQHHTEEQVANIPEQVTSFLHAFQGMEPRLAKAQLQTILKAAHIYRDGKIELEFRQ